MKVKLYGCQPVQFTDENTGERIVGVKLHVVSDTVENDKYMMGQRVATIFTRLDCSALIIGKPIDLVYEQSLGTNKARLVAINQL